MGPLLADSWEEERHLINELSGLPPYKEVCPDAIVLGSRYIDLMSAAVLMSRMVWFPMQSINDGSYRGMVEVAPNRLVCSHQFVGKDGRVFCKFTIGGRKGVEISEQHRAFLKTQIRANYEDRRKNLAHLVGIYLDAKEKRKQASQFAGAIEIAAR